MIKIYFLFISTLFVFELKVQAQENNAQHDPYIKVRVAKDTNKVKQADNFRDDAYRAAPNKTDLQKKDSLKSIEIKPEDSLYLKKAKQNDNRPSKTKKPE